MVIAAAKAIWMTDPINLIIVGIQGSVSLIVEFSKNYVNRLRKHIMYWELLFFTH